MEFSGLWLSGNEKSGSRFRDGNLEPKKNWDRAGIRDFQDKNPRTREGNDFWSQNPESDNPELLVRFPGSYGPIRNPGLWSQDAFKFFGSRTEPQIIGFLFPEQWTPDTICYSSIPIPKSNRLESRID